MMNCCSKNNSQTSIYDLLDDNRRSNRNEIEACGTTFEFNLREVSENTFNLVVTPCSQPTAVYEIARITVRENNCTGLKYFQAFVNTDPVEIIQDCNLRNIICRSIMAYFNGNTPIRCRGCQSGRNNCY